MRNQVKANIQLAQKGERKANACIIPFPASNLGESKKGREQRFIEKPRKRKIESEDKTESADNS